MSVSPELRHLRYFIAVAEELSFTRAAERLHVVQQALSTAIQQLERELGVQLFVRTTRKVELTNAGQRLLDEARPALSAVEHAWESAQQTGSEASRTLRIAYTSTAGYEAVPALHAAALERLEGLRITWWQAWGAEVSHDVAVGRYDAGLARFPQERPEVQCAVVANEQLGVTMSAGHPLARARSVALSDLKDETWLMIPREMAPGYHDATAATLREHIGDPTLVTAPDAGDDGLILGYYARGEAIALAPVSVAQAHEARSRGAIAWVPLREPAPRLPLHLCWDRRGSTPAIKGFVDLARELGAAGSLSAAERPSSD
jgi:DNA-binding transcriptional LysR family regulator